MYIAPSISTQVELLMRVLVVVVCIIGALGSAYMATRSARSKSPHSLNEMIWPIGSDIGLKTISVRDCGATGDGVADDTAAIQRCASLVPPDGATLFFPKG